MIISVRKNIDFLPYDLYHMTISKCDFDEKDIIFNFISGIIKVGNPGYQSDGAVQIKGVDWESSNAFVLSENGERGEFTANKLELKEFFEEYFGEDGKCEFEIIDESYGFNYTRFSGYLNIDGKKKECAMEIFHTGNMEYIEV